MTEKLKPSNESDERGVSPVLGVALLIGITVTLVAVVGIVVLGVGPGASAPSAKMAFSDASATDDTVTITHNGGDALKTSNLALKDGDGNTITFSVSDGELTAGDTVSPTATAIDDGDTLTLVWQNPEGDDTTVLAEYEV